MSFRVFAVFDWLGQRGSERVTLYTVVIKALKAGNLGQLDPGNRVYVSVTRPCAGANPLSGVELVCHTVCTVSEECCSKSRTSVLVLC